MTAEGIAIELASPAGELLRIEWPAEALSDPGPKAADGPAWRLEGELDWDEVEALRIVSAALPDGRGLALAALRPAGAAGHGEEPVAAVLVADGAAEQATEALMSVQYRGDGLPVRVGLELSTGADVMPLRIAADVTDASSGREGELVRVRAALEVRLEGKRSAGAYEALTRDADPATAR